MKGHPNNWKLEIRVFSSPTEYTQMFDYLKPRSLCAHKSVSKNTTIS